MAAAVYGLQPDCNVIDDSAFNICLDITSESGEVEDWFPTVIQQKERWERIITNDPWPTWPRSVAGSLTGSIGTGIPFFGIDDIYVSIRVVPDGDIDGPGRHAC